MGEQPRPRSPRERDSHARRFWRGVARAVAGAVIFSLPLYMTMEMWQLGFSMARGRLALLVVLTYPLLVGLSHVSGFEPTFDLREDAVDAAVAWAVGMATGALALLLLGVLGPGQSASEMVGKVTLQAIPGSIGALLAHSQFDRGDGEAGEEYEREDRSRGSGERSDDPGSGRPDSYWSQLFVMAAGALFLSFNLAPTEEMVLIGYAASPWHLLALIAVTLAAMHAFVYRVNFAGQESITPGTPGWSAFLRYTLVGFVLATAISAYVLWTFGRLDGAGAAAALTPVLVLAVPAAIGAAAARLLL